MKESNTRCQHQGFVHLSLDFEGCSAEVLCGYCGWDLGRVSYAAAADTLMRANATGGRVEHRETKLIVFPRPGAAELRTPEGWPETP